MEISLVLVSASPTSVGEIVVYIQVFEYFLVDTIDTPDALDDAGRVIGYVVIEDGTRTMQVVAFGYGIGGYQNLIIVSLQGRFHTCVEIGSDKVLVGRGGVGRGIFHHWQPRFGKRVAQIVYRVGKFGEHNEFTLWLVLHFLLDDADEGVQLGVVLDCVVLAKPLFAQTFEQSDV